MVFCFVCANAQSEAQNLAHKISQRMADSLGLTSNQKDLLYNVNMQLHDQKMLVRAKHNAVDSVGFYLQVVEDTRDSLYRPIITEEKYLLYKEKKTTLVSN